VLLRLAVATGLPPCFAAATDQPECMFVGKYHTIMLSTVNNALKKQCHTNCLLTYTLPYHELGFTKDAI
jgi:hypothetical protein